MAQSTTVITHDSKYCFRWSYTHLLEVHNVDSPCDTVTIFVILMLTTNPPTITCGELEFLVGNMTSFPKLYLQMRRLLPTVILTSVDVEFISNLPADLCWSDVLLSIKCVHHVKLFLLNQFGNDFDAVPLR